MLSNELVQAVQRALAACQMKRSVTAAVALAISAGAMAQSNSVGSIFGTAGDSGNRVVITNTETGAVRSSNVDANGRFQIPSLPVGTYKVELQKDGATVETRDSVFVAVGSGSEVAFDAETIESVVVTGERVPVIDVSVADTRSVFTAEDLQNVTVKQSIEEIAMLAPGTVRGDSRYNTNRGTPSASFGGSGANENAFYLNGYAITDPIKGLGSSSLPFNGIEQYQLLTGGYGAEFGRSTGGVVNIVTKRGSNNWESGAQISYTANSDSTDIYVPANGTLRDGQLYLEQSKRDTDSALYSAYVSGPIIQDKLFFFLSGELEKRTTEGPQSMSPRPYSSTYPSEGLTGWQDRDVDVPRGLLKLDYNIVDGHSLELTAVSDVRKEERRDFEYYNTTVPASATPGAALRTRGPRTTGGYDYEDGGELYIGKYTGAIMDNLIFTALYGQQENKHEIVPFGYDPTVIPIRDQRNTVATPLRLGSFLTLPEEDAYDKTDGFRIDLNWILGSHDIRFGYDRQDLEIFDGTGTAGPEGYFWEYYSVEASQIGQLIDGGGGAIAPASGEYVTRSVGASGGTFTTDQYAYFLEDRWQVTDNVLLSLGLRNENFKNYNSDKVVFLDQTNQWAPRIGISWDVKGDSSLRVFANAGRYHLAIPLNLAFRQVGGSTNTDEYYAFTSIDPATGIPQGLTALGSGPYSSNQEYGQARDPLAAASQGLEAYYQDEFAIGAEATVFSNMKAGARFIYRDLKSQIDDNCDGRPAYNWAISNGLGTGVDDHDLIGDLNGNGVDDANGLDDGAEEYWLQLAGCRIINPGESNKMRFTNPQTGEDVIASISAEQFGLPELKRTYKGIDLFLEKPFSNNWYAKLDYTLSWSEGNAEGMLYSDSGQEDVAVTANWDTPELMSGGSGYLPNDRRHQIKAFAYYQMTPEWQVSGTVVSASGRPKSYAGTYGGEGLIELATIPGSPAAVSATDYHDAYSAYNGPYYHWVNGQMSKRGSSGRLPWTTVLDLGVRYSPGFILNNQLKLGLDVFNVFNTQQEQNVVEQVRTSNNAIVTTGRMPISYNAPRAVRFTVNYDFK
jgi:outer membrane receptor protein involved in Fe transport